MKTPIRFLPVLLAIGLSTTSAQIVPEAEIASSSYIGGGGEGYTLDSVQAVARGQDGSIYVAGITGSRPFPFTTRIGDSAVGDGSFVTKLSPDGRQVIFSTYLGSLFIRAIAVDTTGSAYVVGETGGYSPLQSVAQPEFGGNFDAFVAKLGTSGSSLDYFTYLGGSQLELAQAVAVDSDGNAYVTGWTTSTNFPVTAGAAQPQLGGRYDAFAAKVSANGGSFVYSTYLGGTGQERGTTLVLDSQRRLVIAGRTSSTNFVSQTNPTRLGTSFGRTDAYVARLNSQGSTVEQLTILGGDGSDTAARIALNASGSLLVLGNTTSPDWTTTPGALQTTNRGEGDLFVTRLAPELTSIEASTYLGSPFADAASRLQYLNGFLVDGEPAGDGNFEIESGGLAISADGSVLINATSWANEWPGADAIGAGNTEALAARLSPDLTSINWLILHGGRDYDSGLAMISDGTDGAWIAGDAGRPIIPPYFPTVAPFQPDFGGGVGDGFLTHLRGPSTSAPANDAFETASSIAGTRVTEIVHTHGASRQTGEPAHADGTGGSSIWWKWIAPSNGFLAVDTSGSDFDTLLAVYRGTTLASLTSPASNDNRASDVEWSGLRLPVVSGETYAIAVDGKDGATGRAVLNIRFSGPRNDDFGDRTILSGFPVFVSGSTTNATAETGDDLRNSGSPGGASVWWEWTATTNGPVAVSMTGSIYQPAIAIYTGTNIDELVLLQADVSSNNPLGVYAREVTFLATAGTRYVIGLDGYYGGTGGYDIAIEPGTPPANDNFADRITLAGLFAQITASNRRATLERAAGEPSLVIRNSQGDPQGPAADSTVWWTWTPSESGRARISVTNANFDSRIAVYTGVSLGSLNRVAANDGPGDDRSSAVSFEAVAGTAYQIQVDGGTYNGRVGTFTLTALLDHPPKILPGSVRLETSGALSFEIEVIPGRPVDVESSSDMRTWSGIDSFVPSEPTRRITVPASTADMQLYRLNSPSDL